MFKFQYQNGTKRKSGKIFSVLQNGAIRRLQIGTDFRDYKSEQEGLQIGAALGISNRGKKITNRGRAYKLVQNSMEYLLNIFHLKAFQLITLNKFYRTERKAIAFSLQIIDNLPLSFRYIVIQYNYYQSVGLIVYWFAGTILFDCVAL